jgi:hypothetical protein
MSKQEKATEEVQRGELARQILDNPIYQESLISIRGELMHKFEQTSFKDSDTREEIWRQIQTVKRFELYIKQVLETGKLGRQTLGLLDKFKNR